MHIIVIIDQLNLLSVMTIIIESDVLDNLSFDIIDDLAK